MDALSHILNSVRLASSVYFLKHFPAPWGMRVAASPHVLFHVVHRGTCWLSLEGERKPVRLSANDVVLLPRGTAHWVADDPRSAKVDGARVIAEHRAGKQTFQGTEPDTTLVCGHFEYDRRAHHPLFDQLPPMLRANLTERADSSWLGPALFSAAQRSERTEPGATALCLRLAEVLFIEVLRAHLESVRPAVGFLFAVADPITGRALSCLHDAPEFSWDLRALAKRTGTSRSTLAARFTALAGVSPMQYLARLRIQKAHELLLDSDLPLGDIARRVGYGSEPAFHRAFKRVVNATPGEVRRKRHRGEPLDFGPTGAKRTSA